MRINVCEKFINNGNGPFNKAKIYKLNIARIK